jgi:hypothetical protein
VLADDSGSVQHVTVEERLAKVSGAAAAAAGPGIERAVALGLRVAEKLMAAGAGPMLERMRRPMV